MDPDQKKDPFRKKPLNEYVYYAGIGIQLAVTLLLFIGLGNILDTHFKFQKPWCVLLGGLIGSTVAFYNLFRQLKQK